MKKNMLLHKKKINIIVPFFFLIFHYSCNTANYQNEPIEQQEEPSVENLNIPIGPTKELTPPFEFVNKSSILERSNWKLNYIVKKGKRVSVNDHSRMNYTLWFYTDSNFSFHTSRNMVFGFYHADENNRIIRTMAINSSGHPKEGTSTGVDFWQFIIDANSFELVENKLKISVDDQSYLLLEKMSNELPDVVHVDDTRWSLVKLIDVEANKQYDIDEDKYNLYGQLKFWLATDGTYAGLSLANSFWGHYRINSSTIEFYDGGVTQVGESEPGNLFLKAMSQEKSFTIENKKLTIQNKKFILTFKPE